VGGHFKARYNTDKTYGDIFPIGLLFIKTKNNIRSIVLHNIIR